MASNRNVMGLVALGAAAGGAIMMARSGAQRDRNYDFRGKTILITGASRGLGLVLARELARHGAKLAICARDPEDLDYARQDIEAHGGTVLPVPCDLSERDEVKRMVEQIIGHYGGIDVLINNASTLAVGPIESMTIEDYREAMENNFWSAVHTAYYVVPHMQQRRAGRIVNIGSIGGKIGVPHLTAYCASKFAVTGWSRSLRAELMKDGIVVTTISPGLMRTGSPRNAEFKGQHKLEYAWFKISDSLPGLSMSAEQAASEIVEATRRGSADVVLGIPAKVAVWFDMVLPDVSGDLSGIASKMLPSMGGIGTASRTGAESESEATQSGVTALTDRAASENNQMA